MFLLVSLYVHDRPSVCMHELENNWKGFNEAGKYSHNLLTYLYFGLIWKLNYPRVAKIGII
jgi:hypothetical protein